MKSAPLGDLCEIVSGATPKTAVRDFWDGDIAWATPADLGELDEACIRETPRRITAAGLRSCAATVLPPGSVLLSSRAPIGHVAINTRPMATNQGFKSLIPKAGMLDAKFLYHWLRANRTHLQSLGNGATFKELSKAAVARVEVPLPPVDEQRRIATILDHADSLRAKRRRALDLLEALPQSVFLDMFGSTTSQVCSVEEVALAKRGAIRTGPFGSQLLHSEFVPEGVAVLGLDNVVRNQFRWEQRRYITEQKYEQLKRYTVSPGDVLISIMGTCGRCVVVPDDIPTAINTKHICAVTVDRTRVFPEYLRACFLWHPDSRRFLARRAKGSIMNGLNMGIIKEMPLPVPPLDQQREFVCRLRNAELGHKLAVRSYEYSEHLIRALQHRAFTGAP